jgi:hypothetical protein
VHTRVEDRVRTGKDCSIGRFPSHNFAVNSAWLTASLMAATLLAWLQLLALDRDLAKASPRPCATGSCTPPPAWPAASAGATSNPRHLALGDRDHHRLYQDPGPPASTLTAASPRL